MVEPVVISNWKHGIQAVPKALEVLRQGGSALDAVEMGIRVVEDDPETQSVGTGGIPNIEGVLELDASIMVGNTCKSGAVTGLTMTQYPISVARKVMEICPHVMLSGNGATRFARATGFPEYDTSTSASKERWAMLRKELLLAMKKDRSAYDKVNQAVGYDIDPTSIGHALEIMIKAGQIKELGTVGTLAIDSKGMIVAGTSTSGLPLRLPGRVSDSSVIGAGTYASWAGAASSTGIGEFVIRHNLTRKVCDYMEEGKSPTDACERALRQMLERENVTHMIGLIALDHHGEVGGAFIGKNEKHAFQYQYQRLSDKELVEVRPTPVHL